MLGIFPVEIALSTRQIEFENVSMENWSPGIGSPELLIKHEKFVCLFDLWFGHLGVCTAIPGAH